MLPVLVAFGLGPSPLFLVPTPQSLARLDGVFPLGRHAPLVVARSKDDEDSYAAEGLIEEDPASFGWSKARRGSPSVLVGRIGRDGTVTTALRKLKLKLPKNAGPDGYIVSVRPRQVVCAGASAAGTYYAVQTLKQLVRANKVGDGVPCVDIVDWPALQIRGWQDDVSRGPIPTLAFLKKQVKELSEYKLNAFTLYTEHVFRLEKHPRIAPKDGLTATEIRDLDNYCRKHHVQLIGNFQSFGHFANILSVPGYENLGETSNVISPAKAESYAFLKDVYDEIAPAYSSSLFNINCDETYGLGEGASKEMVAKEGLGNVYAKHINRISTLLKSHGKTPMMWGDIALQYPDIVKNLPRDLIVLTWGYDPRASFVDQIVPFTKLGFRFLVCPGVSCWGQNFPDLEAATTNISNFVRDGAANGAMGVLNTTWDDTGENLFNNNWYPVVWGAEVSWKPATGADEQRTARLNPFNEAFPRLFYGLPDGKLSPALWKLSSLRKFAVSGGHTDQAFWRVPWQVDASTIKSAPKFTQSVMDVQMAIQHARSSATRNVETLDAAEFAADKMAYLSVQAKMLAQVPEAFGQDAESREWVAGVLTDSLSGQLNRLAARYERAWRLENRGWWLDRNLSKYQWAANNTRGLGTIPWLSPAGGALAKPTSVKVGVLLDGGEVRYTTDGSEPTASSAVAGKEIEISKSVQVRAANFQKDGSRSPVVSALYTLLSRPAKIETPWNHYGEHTRDKAFDGMLDTYFWSYGSVSAGSTFTVVLDEPDMIGGIKVTTGVAEHPDDILHEGVLEVSNEGTRWREVATFEKGVAECGMIGFRVRAIRIRPTKDNGNWLVIREIELR